MTLTIGALVLLAIVYANIWSNDEREHCNELADRMALRGEPRDDFVQDCVLS